MRVYVIPQDDRLVAAMKSVGADCLPFTGAVEEGSVIVAVRPRSEKVSVLIQPLRRASGFGVPVIVVAGTRDGEGEALLHAAEECGIPKQCVVFVEGDQIVDASGSIIGSALRGSGIGVRAVLRVAENAIAEGLVPEPVLWDAGEAVVTKPDAAIWKPAEPLEKSKEEGQTEAATNENGGLSPKESLVEWINSFFTRAEKVVAVFGIKNGIGASTVAACLSGVLSDYNAFYLEVSDSPSGYAYFGSSPEAAAEKGSYAWCGSSRRTGRARDCGILVADVGIHKAADFVYKKANCIVVVADGSPVAFERVKRWVQGGWRLDVLVVNRVLPGAGYPPEVYMGELGLDPERVVGVPGGSEEEMAVNLAQQKHGLPFGKSVDFDGALADLGRAVQRLLEGGNLG